MKKQDISSLDQKLIDAAVEAVKKPVSQLWGETMPARVGAAIRLDDGQVITSVNLIADVGSLSVCAEPIAIAEAVQQPDRTIETIVAVYYKPGEEPRVVSPCGRCREIITDYALNSLIIFREPKTNNLFKVKAEEALPLRYASYWNNKEFL